MDLRKIKKLIELVEESGISELEVKSGDEAIRIARPLAGTPSVGAQSRAGIARIVPEPPAAANTAHVVRAPMAGTFYQAAEPGAEPFVKVGQRVEVGDVLCIIESMKMMNEITVKIPGTVAAIDIANGEPVVSEQVLFRLG
ncbi:MAG: acetyl-CoA carboxylase biotin carboxyl carrier protein [Gammaproteobacteria bacterium]|nr:acetyl-CoA carboxylase biotin carboxyl carrier protein [Gammaproteobacteria bacterium]